MWCFNGLVLAFSGLLAFSVFKSAAVAEEQAGGSAASWALARSRDGIKIFTRTVLGSDFKEFKANVHIKGSLAGVAAVLDAVEKYPEWFEACKEASVFKPFPNGERILYFVIQAPFPLTNRDMGVVMGKQLSADGKSITYTLGNAGHVIPMKKHLVRIPSLKGGWTLSEEGETVGGGVTAEYRFHSDPGGQIPSWLADMTVTDWPESTLKNLRDRVQKNSQLK